MKLDYTLIGKNIARKRKELHLTQEKLSEMVDISNTFMSNIERGRSIPSTEVVMRLAYALETTPDEFLIGSASCHDENWRNVAELLRPMDEGQLAMARSFLTWLGEQKR